MNISKQGIHMILVFVVILSSIMWLFFSFLHTEYDMWLRLVMILVGLAALYLLPSRDVYLPFLGEMAMPLGMLKDTEPAEGTVKLSLTGLPPGAKVVYWGAMPRGAKQEGVVGWKTAYGSFVNGGVSTVDARGVVQLSFACPQSYTINRLGFDKVLPQHIHYRHSIKDSPGMLSRVHTVPVQVSACGA